MAQRALKNDDGWTPVRRGKIYCSPRCGGDCTLAAFEAATRAAESTAKRMGSGWRVTVYENLGWHWRVETGDKFLGCRPFAVIRKYGREFEAEIHAGMLRPPHPTGASTAIQFWGRATTPKAALEEAARNGRFLYDCIGLALGVAAKGEKS